LAATSRNSLRRSPTTSSSAVHRAARRPCGLPARPLFSATRPAAAPRNGPEGRLRPHCGSGPPGQQAHAETVSTYFLNPKFQELAMDIEMRNVADIKPYPHNPRKNDHAVEAVAASIQEFGFRQPLVLDEDGVIVAGETRYK